MPEQAHFHAANILKYKLRCEFSQITNPTDRLKKRDSLFAHLLRATCPVGRAASLVDLDSTSVGATSYHT
jgi:hypothetical protein